MLVVKKRKEKTSSLAVKHPCSGKGEARRMEGGETYSVIIITLLIIVLAYGLKYLMDINEKCHTLEKRYSALLLQEEEKKKSEIIKLDRPENVNIEKGVNNPDEVIASLTRMVEESQRKMSEAHLAAQKSYADLATMSEQHSERLFKELKTTQKFLGEILQKNERLVAENAELSKEVHELKLKVALLESITKAKRLPATPFVAKVGSNEPKNVLSLSSPSTSFKDDEKKLFYKPSYCLLYGDEINLTASVPDKPFEYLSDGTEILTRDKRLYTRKSSSSTKGKT